MLDSFRSGEFARERLQARRDSPTLFDALFALLRRRGFDAPDGRCEALDGRETPALWEARTYLDTKHGAGGCPFFSEEKK